MHNGDVSNQTVEHEAVPSVHAAFHSGVVTGRRQHLTSQVELAEIIDQLSRRLKLAVAERHAGVLHSVDVPID